MIITILFLLLLLLFLPISLSSLSLSLSLLSFLHFQRIVDVQLISCVRLFVTPWTAARQASLSFTISQSLLKLLSIELMMPSNHPRNYSVICHWGPCFGKCSCWEPWCRTWPVITGGTQVGRSTARQVCPDSCLLQGWVISPSVVAPWKLPLDAGCTGLPFHPALFLGRLTGTRDISKLAGWDEISLTHISFSTVT